MAMPTSEIVEQLGTAIAAEEAAIKAADEAEVVFEQTSTQKLKASSEVRRLKQQLDDSMRGRAE
jgi:hypothetical protein